MSLEVHEENTTPVEAGLLKCTAAEALGTFLLVFFGCGAVHVAVLFGDLHGLWQVGIVWGVSIMLAIYVVGGISGAHINPAVTIALATWQLFPVRRVAAYLAAQLAGAFLAAAVLYSIFHPFLAERERQKGVVRGQPGSEITAMCYCEFFPNPGPFASTGETYQAAEHQRWIDMVSESSAFLAEFLGTAILALVVVAVTDERNPFHPGRVAPVFIGLTVAALISVIAPITQACFNPARDYGPRLFAFLAGWNAIAIPGPRPSGTLTVYLLAPILGAICGAGLYCRCLGPRT
ncbi:MAG: glycerol uptake facilitator protein [Gemmatales bacterium]|nr:MAG: glycerol uptake facilitator protein [Gemmatales bacterium]